VPDVPLEPFWPDVPLVPVEPEVPLVPLLPLRPDVPDVPEGVKANDAVVAKLAVPKNPPAAVTELA
jgi:hypothetical protein